MVTFNLLINAVVTGILLGGFYAAVTIGITIAFGMLDIVNIAHPVFIIMGSFVAYIVNRHFGFDPILTVIVAAPLFFLLGIAIFRFYYAAFESSGKGSLRGTRLLLRRIWMIEVTLLLAFSIDYRLVQTSYIGPNISLSISICHYAWWFRLSDPWRWCGDSIFFLDTLSLDERSWRSPRMNSLSA